MREKPWFTIDHTVAESFCLNHSHVILFLVGGEVARTTFSFDEGARHDFRRFLESGLRSTPRRDGWTRERQSMSVT